MQKHKLCDYDPVPRWQRLDIAILLFPMNRVSAFQYYDGTLQNHIAYLRSVVRYVDQFDQYARAFSFAIIHDDELTSA
jgi:hypothetical protein